MKRISRIFTALLLVAVMILSLAGCSKVKDLVPGKSSSKGPETVWDALREFQDWEAYECEAKIEIKSDEVNGTVTIANGKIAKDGNDLNMQYDVSFEGSIDAADVDLDETFIGTFTMLGGVLYIDITETDLFDVIEDLAGMEIDDDMIESALVDTLGMKSKDVPSTRVFSLEIGSPTKKAKSAQDALTDAFIKMMEKALDEYTEKDEKNPEWTVSFDQKSAPDVVTGVMQAFMDDFDNIWDNAVTLVEESQNLAIYQKVEDLLGDMMDTSSLDDFLDNSDEYADELADGIEELLDDPEPIEESFSDMKFTSETVIGYTAKKDANELTMDSTVNVKSPEKITVTITATYKQADVKIEEPDEATDLSKALDAAAGMMGGIIGPVGPIDWPTEPETEPMTFAPASTEAPTQAPAPTETAAPQTETVPSSSASSGAPTVSGPVGDDLVIVGKNGAYRMYVEDIGNGFTPDLVTYADGSNYAFVDFHDSADNYAYLYLYEIAPGYVYTPDEYYQSEIVEEFIDNPDYPDAAADTPSYMYSWAANDFSTDYDIYYTVLTYTDTDGEKIVKLCSYSNLETYDSTSDAAYAGVSVEVEVTEAEYEAMISELGSDYDILNKVYQMIRVEQQ